MRMPKSFITQLLFLTLLSGFATLTALAQSNATLQGTVTDPSGSAVTNATIIVRNTATGLERTVQTDSAGSYQIAALPPGSYRVEVQAQGFSPQILNNVTLEVSSNVVQNIQLKVGNVTQEVNVTSDAPVVETTTITVGQVINQKTVQEIPLNGRHFVDLGLLIAGSVTPPQNGFLTAPLRGQGSFAFNTAGNREDTVNFMINGINLNDQVQNQITFQPSINTVQEFKVDNSTYGAEFGRNSGAIVNIATRSGTNQFHGEAFEFLRNDALDARNFFDVKKPPFKRNQFGGALGGPIFKDKSFFFFSYEGLRQRQGLTINSGVLSDAQRAQVTDPVIKKLLPLIPVANFNNNGVAQFRGAGTAPVNIDQWTGDVSHNFGTSDRLHGYYAFQRDERGEPTLGGNTLPGFGDTRQSHRQIFTLNETHTFSPTVVNEARFGFNRIFITFTPNAQLNPTDFGINIGINEPLGLPQINITGATLNFGGPSGFPQGRGDTTFVTSDTLSWLRGRHSLKLGGEFRYFLNNNFSRDTGSLNFASLAAFIAGTANQFNVTLGSPSSSIAQGALGFFAQDSYKVRNGLTLELGLRYDWNKTPTERYDRFVVFDPRTASLVRIGSGLDEVYKQNAKNFEPRLGFAWDIFNDTRTVLRGAYAILTDQPITNLVTTVTTNPPLANPLALPAGRTTTPATAINDVRAAASLSPNSVDHNFDNSYVQSWNLNLQREITPSIGVMIGYFASKGTHLRITRNINQFINGVRPFAALSATSPIQPGTALNNISERDSAGNSSYNALWLTANKRFSRGLQFNASYTFSKSIDYNSQNGQGVTVQDSYNIRGDRGLSDFDARHRFVINAIYELPFKGNRLVEGWQLSTITQLQTGNPVNIVTNINNLTGVANTLRPDLLSPIENIGRVNQWFSNVVCDPRVAGSCTGANFALPVATVNGASVFHFGSLGRNVIIGPGFANTDFSVTKNTKITEALRAQFRAEIFDVFNHANFGQPGRIAAPGSTAFGVITNTRFATGDSGSSRQVQFALKLIF
ncbi:MAG: carboxypeptidase regulatory-like domain-containing protein [Blastocatellia bacterium]